MGPQKNIPCYNNRKCCCQFHSKEKGTNCPFPSTSLKYMIKCVVSVSSQINEDMISGKFISKFFFFFLDKVLN